MTRRPEQLLADRVALALLEHGPAPCELLARIVEARTVDVRAILRSDPRFVRSGGGRGSRWRLELDPHPDTRDGLGRILSPDIDLRDVPDAGRRLRALERRVATLERLLIEREAST